MSNNNNNVSFIVEKLKITYLMLHYPRPASSSFLVRQTREKPLRATVCFSIEHARVRHAARDAFDVNFICQLQSKQVKRFSHEWINKFIIANLISVIISIICSSDE